MLFCLFSWISIQLLILCPVLISIFCYQIIIVLKYFNGCWLFGSAVGCWAAVHQTKPIWVCNWCWEAYLIVVSVVFKCSLAASFSYGFIVQDSRKNCGRIMWWCFTACCVGSLPWMNWSLEVSSPWQKCLSGWYIVLPFTMVHGLIIYLSLWLGKKVIAWICMNYISSTSRKFAGF